MVLGSHRRVNAVSQFFNDIFAFRPANAFGPPGRHGPPHGPPPPFHHGPPHGPPGEHHGPPDHNGPPPPPLFADRSFRCPRMHGLRARLERIERAMNRHSQFSNLQQEFTRVQNNVALANSQLPQVMGLPSLVGTIEEMERSFNRLMAGFTQSMSINRIQSKNVDPVIEAAVASLTEFNADDKLLSPEQKTELQSLLDDLSRGNTDLNTHVETISRSYSSLDEALADMPALFNSLVEKVNHMDESHHDAAVEPGSAAEAKLKDIETHIDKIDKLAEELDEDKLKEIKEGHETVVELHDKQYEKLNSIKVIEDGINDVQEKKADLANQVLSDLNKKPEIIGQPYLETLRNVLESLAAVTD